MVELPWHHVHITLNDREAAALWHEKHTPTKRAKPTKRSENLYYGPNLLQIQSTTGIPEPRNARIDSIGMGVSDIHEFIDNWQSSGGSVDNYNHPIARVQDPWGVPFELVERSHVGYTHINIAAEAPEQLRDWYESNLGGIRVTCEWDSTRFALAYDTMLIVFDPASSPVSSIAERPIDHLGWYTPDLDAIFKQLSAKGVFFPVKPMAFGPVRLAFAEDPCGNWIELLEPQGGLITKQT
ncbi:MAG: VOC family protein [Promethearchaeota archaeon]|jgi:catechol 2,3-dioxygenase-like lactoylglutathione lyase family enzyme